MSVRTLGQRQFSSPRAESSSKEGSPAGHRLTMLRPPVSSVGWRSPQGKQTPLAQRVEETILPAAQRRHPRPLCRLCRQPWQERRDTALPFLCSVIIFRCFHTS